MARLEAASSQQCKRQAHVGRASIPEHWSGLFLLGDGTWKGLGPLHRKHLLLKWRLSYLTQSHQVASLFTLAMGPSGPPASAIIGWVACSFFQRAHWSEEKIICRLSQQTTSNVRFLFSFSRSRIWEGDLGQTLKGVARHYSKRALEISFGGGWEKAHCFSPTTKRCAESSN